MVNTFGASLVHAGITTSDMNQNHPMRVRLGWKYADIRAIQKGITALNIEMLCRPSGYLGGLHPCLFCWYRRNHRSRD